MKHFFKQISLITATSVAVILLILVFGFWKMGDWGNSKLNAREQKQLQNEKSKCPYQFLNPLRCEFESPQKAEYTIFKQRIENYISAEKKSKNIIDAAVYFRDLNNGPTFGINDQTEFAPMSLMKLPVMMGVLKLAEQQPEILQKQIKVEEKFGKNIQVMDIGKTLETGKIYTVEELLEFMIAYSDNRALEILGEYLETFQSNFGVVRTTLSDLGIVGFESANPDALIKTKSFASLFRILYNGSYLNNEMSEKGLTILSKTEFRNGLRIGVPEKIKIAHKFGIRDYGDGEVQLHDCGIIYFPNNPYLLCVMSRGEEYNKLVSFIGTVSRLVYDENVSRQNIK